jgi:hypothetical protein
MEHGMGFEPMYNGFAGRRVSHFATRAQKHKTHLPLCLLAQEKINRPPQDRSNQRSHK